MYALGRGVKGDEAQAAQWFRKAAEQGDPQAQTALGLSYAEGHGMPVDKAEAVKWWRKAAKQGNKDAQNVLSQRGLEW
jgi:hypothetical protein